MGLLLAFYSHRRDRSFLFSLVRGPWFFRTNRVDLGFLASSKCVGCEFKSRLQLSYRPVTEFLWPVGFRYLAPAGLLWVFYSSGVGGTSRRAGQGYAKFAAPRRRRFPGLWGERYSKSEYPWRRVVDGFQGSARIADPYPAIF